MHSFKSTTGILPILHLLSRARKMRRATPKMLGAGFLSEMWVPPPILQGVFSTPSGTVRLKGLLNRAVRPQVNRVSGPIPRKGNKASNGSKDLEKLHLHTFSSKSDLAEAGYRNIGTFYEIPCGLTDYDVGTKGLV